MKRDIKRSLDILEKVLNRSYKVVGLDYDMSPSRVGQIVQHAFRWLRLQSEYGKQTYTMWWFKEMRENKELLLDAIKEQKDRLNTLEIHVFQREK